MKKNVLLIFVLLLILHIPFLTADPDNGISFSRDAFTDEGLYTSQVRNFLITGDFNINESDASIKTPLFSLFMLVVFKIGGMHLLTARLAVLLISLVTMFCVFRKDFMLTCLVAGVCFIQYTVFHYSHFALAEILAVSSLVLAWFFMSNEVTAKEKYRNNLIIAILVVVAMYFKFQYLYMAMWPVVYFSMLIFYSWFMDRKEWKYYAGKLILSVLFVSTGLLVYYLFWYLPNSELFEYVIKSQTTVVFGEGEWFRKMIDFNIENFFMNETTRPLTFLFLICFLAFPYLLFHYRFNKQVVFQLLAAFSWCLLELHKPALAYLPGRYLVSTFFAMGLFSALILKSIYQAVPNNYFRLITISALLAWPIYINVTTYANAFNNRTYLLREVNKFVKVHSLPGCTIAGPWAPSISWMSGSPSIPVWKDYFNDKNTMQKISPCIIVSETDEEDSGSAWKSQGVFPEEISMASTGFKIHNWNVKVYVLKSGANAH